MGGAAEMFSSPSKQGTQSGEAQQSLAQNEINQGESYINNANANTRGAIAGLGDNPFFGGSNQRGTAKTGGALPAAPTPLSSGNFTPVAPPKVQA